MHFSKSLQGYKSAITMRLVSIESTLLLFLLICNFLDLRKKKWSNSKEKMFKKEIYLQKTKKCLGWNIHNWTMVVKHDRTRCAKFLLENKFPCFCKPLHKIRPLIRHQNHERFRTYIAYEKSSYRQHILYLVS